VVTDDRSAAFDFSDVAERVAGAWERHADYIQRVTEPVKRWLIEHLDAKPGETIVELGAGPGDTGFEAAQKVGAEGRLISTDIAQGMVDAARRRAEKAGVSNVEFRVMDAHKLDFAASSVDGVIHRFGPMLLSEPSASFAEVRRVLRDAGRYVAATFTGPENNPWMTTLAMSVMQTGVQMPESANPLGPGGPFSLPDPDGLRSLVAAAGFGDVDVEPINYSFDYKDVDEGWSVVSELSGPLAVLISRLEPDKRDAVKGAYVQAAENFKSDSGLSFPAQALGVFAH
jgi:ubiquinone/menaquinone biosynthesis C-methylase UbiE